MMKFFAVFAFLVAVINTLPGTEAFVTDQVIIIIDEFIESIKEKGLDPFYIKRETGYYALPVPVIFNASGFCEEVLSTGLSNIVINDIHYDFFSFRLTFDIEIPRIHFSVKTAVVEAVIFDNKLYGEGSGSLDIYKVRVKGVVNIGLIGGIGARAAVVDLNIAAIDSNLKLSLLSVDVSNYLNMFLEEIVPKTLQDFKSEVDELIGLLLVDFINENYFS